MVPPRGTLGSATAAAHATVHTPPVIYLENRNWPLRWEQRLNDGYIDWSCGMGVVLTVFPKFTQVYDDTDGSFVRAHPCTASKTLLFLPDAQYAGDFNNLLDAQRFDLDMQLHGHIFYMLDHGTVSLTTPGA